MNRGHFFFSRKRNARFIFRGLKMLIFKRKGVVFQKSGKGLKFDVKHAKSLFRGVSLKKGGIFETCSCMCTLKYLCAPS